MTIDDDDRSAYLEGDDDPGLDPEERRALDHIRALLADPIVWEEPGEHLEADIVAAIGAQALAAAAAGRTERRLRDRRRLLAVAAAVIVALAAIAVRSWLGKGPATQHFAMALDPTPLAVHASGQATLTKTASGWRIVVHASGLARLDLGRYYQAWLKNGSGTLVPVGTFNDARDVTLWAGVSPVDFPTLTVTIEAADGNQASSGRRVLLGTIDH
jgi:Anti-sigma-K factor rskA